MKAFWQGSDSLYLIKYPPSLKRKYIYMFCFRLFARLVDFFVCEHVCAHKFLVGNLEKFGMKRPISVRADVVLYPKKFAKIKHTHFNILYYFPARKNRPFAEWLYGYDIFQQLQKELSTETRINWVVVDGSCDMSEVFPIIDFYVRPNRHDGHPRLLDECEINDIPYYHSRENPKLEDIIEKIIKIKGSKK